MAIAQDGLLRVVTNDQLNAQEEREAAIQEAAITNNAPVLQGLAGYVTKCWESARATKQPVINRLIEAQLARLGKYNTQKLAEIKEFGGSEEYARVVANKSRIAEAWLRDVYLGQTEKPWSLKPTPSPNVPEEERIRVRQMLSTELAQTVALLGSTPPPSMVQSRLAELEEAVNERMRDEARQAVEQMERYIHDQLVEGGFETALGQFLIDLTTFPAAHIKGPILRQKTKLVWRQQGAQWTPVVEASVAPEFERVSPFDAYPSPGATSPQDGYFIHRQRFTQGDLHDLIGVEGFDENAIRAVIEEYGRGGLTNWLGFAEDDIELKETSVVESPLKHIDVLEFHGPVTGRDLMDWGLEEKELDDVDKSYEACVWLVGRWVIKAQLNYDPLKRRPFHKASWEELPGSYWGAGLGDNLADVQGVVNAAVRALVNNMSIASGPQVEVDVDNLPPGETIETLRPWKIWQVQRNGFGGSSGPIVNFFQPNMNANELLTVIEKFYQFADDWSLIPRYMSGNDRVGGAGRTASGLSMLFNAANKGLKGVVSTIDLNVIRPLLEQLYSYNMMFGDPQLAKADAQVMARGAVSLMQLETLQLRRNEFLTATANPLDSQIVGLEGRAEILREVAKGLEMDINRVVPPKNMMMAQPMQQPGQPQAPGPNGEQLQNGAAVTDNFSPNKMRNASSP
jgi:hypothetical protein